MDAKTRKALQDFGFGIEEDGKHYRLTFFGDDRYNTTVAKTPSDARAGKNIARYIEQMMTLSNALGRVFGYVISK